MVCTRSMGPPDPPRVFMRDSELRTMFPFCRLPIELRLYIWKAYCDDMTPNPRILSFDIKYGQFYSFAHRPVCAIVQPGTFLSEQTRELRRILAVHRESRHMALGLFPHTLSWGSAQSGSIVRFNKRRDICLLIFSGGRTSFSSNASGVRLARKVQERCLAGFRHQVINLALQSTALRNIASLDADIPPWSRLFTALERLFVFDKTATPYPNPTSGQWLPALEGHSHVNMIRLQAPNLVRDNRRLCTLLVCWPVTQQPTTEDRARWSQWLTSHLNVGENRFRENFLNPNIDILPMVSICSDLPRNEPIPAWSKDYLSNIPWLAAYAEVVFRR